MKVAWNIFIVVVLLAGVGVVGFFVGHRAVATTEPSASAADDSIQPMPAVQTAPIQKGRIDRKITAYGVVTAQSGDMQVLSVPFESRVKKILVVGGQQLEGQTPMIELEPSPDTQLQMMQAKAAFDAATKDLEQIRRRFNDHLATNQELLQAEQNRQATQLKWESLQKAGAGGPLQLKGSGLVSKVDVQEGQIVPAGGALLELAAGNKLQVRLGVEPSDAAVIHPGDSVSLQQTHAVAPAVQGKVSVVAQRISPDTHLTDVLVSIPPDAAMPLDAYIVGQFVIAGKDGLVVPRPAVLPDDEGGLSLFTVEQGKAVKHKVSLIAEDDQSAEIAGEGLSPGAPVVVVGNMELEDGMSVKTGGESDEAPATQPTTQEAAK